MGLLNSLLGGGVGPRRLGPLVEVGAGTGYWSALLAAAGCDVIATDAMASGDIGYGFEAGTRWPIEQAIARDAAARWADRSVFCSWPSRDEPWCAEMAASLQAGGRLALIIEPPDGVTGSAALYEILRRDYRLLDRVELPQFPSNRDALYLLERL